MKKAKVKLKALMDEDSDENSDFEKELAKGNRFWAQMALASLVPFQGPKNSRFSGPTPSNAPSNDVAPLKTIMYKRHKNNWYIGSFVYSSAVV